MARSYRMSRMCNTKRTKFNRRHWNPTRRFKRAVKPGGNSIDTVTRIPVRSNAIRLCCLGAAGLDVTEVFCTCCTRLPGARLQLAGADSRTAAHIHTPWDQDAKELFSTDQLQR